MELIRKHCWQRTVYFTPTDQMKNSFKTYLTSSFYYLSEKTIYIFDACRFKFLNWYKFNFYETTYFTLPRVSRPVKSIFITGKRGGDDMLATRGRGGGGVRLMGTSSMPTPTSAFVHARIDFHETNCLGFQWNVSSVKPINYFRFIETDQYTCSFTWM